MRKFVIYKEERILNPEHQPKFHLEFHLNEKSGKGIFPFPKSSIEDLALAHWNYVKGDKNEECAIKNGDTITTIDFPNIVTVPGGALIRAATPDELRQYYLKYCRASGLLR